MSVNVSVDDAIGIALSLRAGLAREMHPGPRPGCDERSSHCSDELLSVHGVGAVHLMQHALEAQWQTPVTNAPHLFGRSLCSDPRKFRARRPLTISVPCLQATCEA